MNVEFQYKSLVQSLRLLANPYEKQRDSLPDFVVVQDEVVNSFGDAFLLLPQLIETGNLPLKAIASIVRCFNQVDMATRNSDWSDLEIFKNHECWEKVRYFAHKALEDIGEPTENRF